MADAENFEDDLFADLYDDNEPAGAPAQAAPVVQAPAVSAQSKPQSSVEAPSRPEPEQAHNDVAHMNEENVTYDDTYQDEAYDDDDDVDFNLGNDQSSVTATANAQPHHEESTPTYHGSHAPGAKEDG
ncbi:GTPase-activating protein [Hypoxylon texense]